MTSSFLLLLLASAAVTVVALLLTLRLRRSRGGGGRALVVAGAGQALVGVLWVAWGAVALQGAGNSHSAGVVGLLLGVLSLWQGGRRIVNGRRRR